MAEERSNAGIAATLVLRVGAVEKHVQSILSKLACPSPRLTILLAVLAYLEDA
jgi:DNA-binding NarL/FixJ family response regulator